METEHARLRGDAAAKSCNNGHGRLGSIRAMTDLHKRTGRRSKKSGLPPGTLVYVGGPRSGPVRFTLLQYGEGGVREEELKTVDECLSRLAAAEPGSVTWLDVGGLHDVRTVEQLGKHFSLHPLLLEDVVNTEQRPKREEYDHVLYVVVKMLTADAVRSRFEIEQVSFVLTPKVLISFQENGGDVFKPVRDRLRAGKGKMKSQQGDYLLYSLIDAVVDQYFAVLELMGERIALIEDRLLADPSPDVLRDLHAMKRDLLFLRRAVWPLREVLSALERGHLGLIAEETRVYFRDVYDHAVQVIDTVETLRETGAQMLDVYLSSTTYRMTGVMKVLTIITTIFMPLSLVTGLYGMNFRYMPGLNSTWGFASVLAVMLTIGIVMIAIFRKKRWL